MVELATGSCPYKSCQGDFEVLTKIIEDDPPLLSPQDGFSIPFCSFIQACLTKDHKYRPKYKKLLDHQFIRLYELKETDVVSWLKQVHTPYPYFQHVQQQRELLEQHRQNVNLNRRFSASSANEPFRKSSCSPKPSFHNRGSQGEKHRLSSASPPALFSRINSRTEKTNREKVLRSDESEDRSKAFVNDSFNRSSWMYRSTPVRQVRDQTKNRSGYMKNHSDEIRSIISQNVNTHFSQYKPIRIPRVVLRDNKR